MTILDTIITEKYKEVDELKNLISVRQLEKRKGYFHNPISMKNSIVKQGSSGIIAEFKRKSPSKGIINNNASVEEVTTGYYKAGVSGVSILTDRHFFGGSAIDVIAARELIEIPILRKDFIVDEYQIVEAKAMGADVILLIAACLEKNVINKLASCAKNLGLEILLELHAPEELDKINNNIDMIGINNRNLKDFKVDLVHSLNLAAQIPDNFIKVSESGIDDVKTILKLKNEGFKGFLIGENFMKTDNPGDACSKFINELTIEK
jgi:indole-3-glycerol phosphate synthase